MQTTVRPQIEAQLPATATAPAPARDPFARDTSAAWVLWVPAVVLLGYAVDIEYGPHPQGGLLALALALACALVAVAAGRSTRPDGGRRDQARTIGALGVALAIQFCLSLRSAPVPGLLISEFAELRPYLSGVGFAA